MKQEKSNYNILIGVTALVVIVLTVSVVGYVVSKPKPYVIQGEAEATEYRVSGKVPGRIEEFRAEEGSTVRPNRGIPRRGRLHGAERRHPCRYRFP